MSSYLCAIKISNHHRTACKIFIWSSSRNNHDYAIIVLCASSEMIKLVPLPTLYRSHHRAGKFV